MTFKNIVVILTSIAIFSACNKDADKGKSQQAKSADTKVGTPDVSKMTDMQKLSYHFGAQLGDNIKNSKRSDAVLKNLDIEILTEGLKDAAYGKKLKVTSAEARKVMANYYAIRAKQVLETGKKFLENKRKEKNVIAHKSGILYEIIKPGKGKSPKENDKIMVHYSGLKTDGKEFDSSYRAGTPQTFRLSGMIEAWKIILPLMKEGARWRIYVPYNLAYGTNGSPPRILPYEVLIFNIELIKVNPEPAKKTGTTEKTAKPEAH